jgi:hypothetical protein
VLAPVVAFFVVRERPRVWVVVALGLAAVGCICSPRLMPGGEPQ